MRWSGVGRRRVAAYRHAVGRVKVNTGDGGVNRREGGRCCTCCGTREQIILLRIRPPTSGLGLHTKQARGDGSQFRRHRREGGARLYAGAVPWRPLFSAALLTAATAAWGGTSWTGGRRAAQGRLRPGWAAARAQRHAQTARSRRRRLPQPPGRSGSCRDQAEGPGQNARGQAQAKATPLHRRLCLLQPPQTEDQGFMPERLFGCRRTDREQPRKQLTMAARPVLRESTAQDRLALADPGSAPAGKV